MGEDKGEVKEKEGGLELESSCLRIRARRGACKATRLALLSNSPDRQMVGGSCSNWA